MATEDDILKMMLGGEEPPRRGSRLQDMQRRTTDRKMYGDPMIAKVKAFDPELVPGTDSWYEAADKLGLLADPQDPMMSPEEEVLRTILGDTNASASTVPVEKFQQRGLPFEDLNMEKAAKMQSSVHGTNADERAHRMQAMESRYVADEEGEEPMAVDDLDATDGGMEDRMWKIIQQYGDGKDGEQFYALPGREALATIGYSPDPELEQFWDKLEPEDRYYMIKALGASAGMGTNKQLEDDTYKLKESEGYVGKEIIDQMMEDENR